MRRPTPVSHAQAKPGSASNTPVFALKAHPGEIADEQLEREKGGSGLRYLFGMRRGKNTREVGVDVRTGAVLENACEGPPPD
jgi:uncharacterized membrane protein YkoI